MTHVFESLFTHTGWNLKDLIYKKTSANSTNESLFQKELTQLSHPHLLSYYFVSSCRNESCWHFDLDKVKSTLRQSP